MQLFRLAEIAKSRRPEIVLPPLTDSVGAVTEAQRVLRKMVRELAAGVKADLLPAYEADLARYQAALTGDAGEYAEQALNRIKDLTNRLRRIAEELVNRILRREAGRHTEKWRAQVRAALGIDLEAVVRQEDIAEPLDAAVKRAASLITGLADETAAGVEKLTRQALLRGQPARDLAKDLTKQFGVADRRAKVIARDQLATLNSDLNRIRHEQAGVTTYEWSTSHDERVRPLHRSLDGRRYKYGESTGAEGGLPPGQPIMCRCVARAIVEFDGQDFSGRGRRGIR